MMRVQPDWLADSGRSRGSRVKPSVSDVKPIRQSEPWQIVPNIASRPGIPAATGAAAVLSRPKSP